jgi:type II secretion system protein H
MMLAVGVWNGKPARQAGYSLLEMLIVITAVGILYTLVGSLLGLSVSDPLNEEVARLRERVSLAQDESVVRSQALALGFSDKGYAFFTQGADKDGKPQWEPIKDDDLLRQYELPDGYKQVLDLQGQAVVLDALHPQVFILPTGEMTPFEWHLRSTPEREGVLKFDAQGRLQDAAHETG